jgi:hypothetical protein
MALWLAEEAGARSRLAAPKVTLASQAAGLCGMEVFDTLSAS